MSQKRQPPPLPPRVPLIPLQSTPDEDPPEYEEFYNQPLEHSWSAQDPRSTSTQSLVPPKGDDNKSKRTLLLIYIHGFMGNETSFQSFPAHVHNVVTVALADTHVIHTKIYPKYKSRRAIEFARDGFSEWLCPNESPATDVILIGHSMGGILATEVALLPADSPNSKFRHRILGTISFDTPFIGMHPGVVISGIGSLFKPAAAEPPSANATGSSPSTSLSLPNGQSQMAMDSFSPTSSTASLYTTNSQSLLSSEVSREPGAITTLPTDSQSSIAPSYLGSPPASINDPNYDPPFPNDVRLPTRTGWNNALHFLMKHSDGLTQATKSYVTSHLEFGGALADYNGLKNRYQNLRALEDAEPPNHRIRFVNYYTASTGRPPQPKRAPSVPLEGSRSSLQEASKLLEEENEGMKESESQETSKPPEDEMEDMEEFEPEEASEVLEQEMEEMNMLEPAPLTDSETDHQSFKSADSTISNPSPSLLQPSSSIISKTTSDKPTPTPARTTSLTTTPTLPPTPPAPTEPPSFDPTTYPEKDVRKLAEKEHARLTKTYQSAVKERDRAIKDRRKLLEKREKEREKALQREHKQRLKEERDAAKLGQKTAPRTAAAEETKEEERDKVTKPPRDRRFCMLPSKVNGEVDPCWRRVFMEGVDEVGAHCGLFFVGPHYEGLVADVGGRVVEWVTQGEAAN